MILLFLAAAVAHPIDKCADAVRQIEHVPTSTIDGACSASTPNPNRLWDQTAGEPPACDKARELARYAAHSQDLPPTMLDGIIREFDNLVATCKAPPVKRDTTKDRAYSKRLWG